MKFNKVNFDGDLSEMDDDELTELVDQYQKAQETNVAEFKQAKEAMAELVDADENADFEDIFGEVQDFTDAKDELVDEVKEFDAFADSPVSESELEDAAFSKVREWHAYFAAAEAAPEDDDGEFDDMGKRGETGGDEEEAERQFAEKHLSGMAGFQRKQ